MVLSMAGYIRKNYNKQVQIYTLSAKSGVKILLDIQTSSATNKYKYTYLFPSFSLPKTSVYIARICIQNRKKPWASKTSSN